MLPRDLLVCMPDGAVFTGPGVHLLQVQRLRSRSLLLHSSALQDGWAATDGRRLSQLREVLLANRLPGQLETRNTSGCPAGRAKEGLRQTTIWTAGVVLVGLLSSCHSVDAPAAIVQQDSSVSVLVLLPFQSTTDLVDVTAMSRAVDAVVAAHDGAAGRFRVQIIHGDTTDPSNGSEWFASCPGIAASHVSDVGVVAGLGPLTDACAAGVVPVFNQAGIAMVSPAVTSPVFTHVPIGAEMGGGECSLQPARFRLDGCLPASFQPSGAAYSSMCRRAWIDKVWRLLQPWVRSACGACSKPPCTGVRLGWVVRSVRKR